MKFRLGLSAEKIESRIDPRLKGVGMIRSEYLCREREEYITLASARQAIYEYVSKVCRIFHPYEVWYRTTELIVPEVNVLKGADHIFEEKYYIYGLRGVRRGLKYKETFLLELENIARIAAENDNLHVLFPYIGDTDELYGCLELLKKAGFSNNYGIMAEIPSAVLLLDEFAKMGIKNITIGTNDLTGLTLGIHRGADIPRTHPAVLKQIERALLVGSDYDIPVSVGGYVDKSLISICERIGVDYLILHYSSLPDILGCAKKNLPELNTLKEIKKLTKSRREEYEKELWRKKLADERKNRKT